jgi:hypothetical protein
VYHLRMTVAAPVSGEEHFHFTFGFALVHDQKLVLFRVQDHLRRMGLARQALQRLPRGIALDYTALRKFSGLPAGQVEERELATELREMAKNENLNRFEQLFRSAQQERAHAAVSAG